MTDLARQLLDQLEQIQQWDRDVRATLAKYRRLGAPLPLSEVQRLLDASPVKATSRRK